MRSATTVQVDKKFLDFTFRLDGTHNSISTRILCALGSWHIDFIAKGRDPLEEGSKSERKFMYEYPTFIPQLPELFSASLV